MDPYVIALSVLALGVIGLTADAWASRRENRKLRKQIVDLAIAITPLHEIKQGNLEAARLMLAAKRDMEREKPSAGAPEQPKKRTGITITQTG